MSVRRGDTFVGPEHLIRPETLKLWSEILRDPNPIHLDPAVVRAKGLGDRVICQGPANVAYVIDAVLARFAGARIAHIAVRFLDNVFAGEKVSASGTVTQVESTPEGLRIQCDLALHADKRNVLSGAATLLAPPSAD